MTSHSERTQVIMMVKSCMSFHDPGRVELLISMGNTCGMHWEGTQMIMMVKIFYDFYTSPEGVELLISMGNTRGIHWEGTQMIMMVKSCMIFTRP